MLPNAIVDAQDISGNKMILDFKSLCSTKNAYKHSKGKFGGGVEVPQKHYSRSYRLTAQNLDVTQNKNPWERSAMLSQFSTGTETEVRDALV
jgi:hypothetical protein